MFLATWGSDKDNGSQNIMASSPKATILSVYPEGMHFRRSILYYRTGITRHYQR